MTKIKNFDTAFCGKVPLHQTNVIQPHGVLLVVKKDDFTIVQGSENAQAVFAQPIADIIGRNLPSLLAEKDLSRLSLLFGNSLPGKLPFAFTVHGKRFVAMAEQQEHFYILEMDRNPRNEGEEQSFLSVYQDIKIVMAAIEACTTTEETCRAVARELKALSGFDKVMVYRFDSDWHGDVLAEEAEPGMESYLGLKFPASDIPKPARELYKKSPFRLIPTVDYEGVRLFPTINPPTASFTDLSNSNLRSVASVHLEYLRNMKVNASMSTRILKDGELWGLISCHHRTPKYLSYEMCSVFEWLSNVVTAKISAVQNSDSYHFKAAKREVQQRVVASVLSNGRLDNGNDDLLQLLDAGGVAITGEQHIISIGETPDRQEIEDLVYWLKANGITSLYHQPSLPAVYEAAEAYAGKGSGLLALPVETEKGEFLLAFRAEAVHTVRWGGNPNEALQFEADGKKYHPRASFKIWQQTVQQAATPWRPEVLDVAESLRNFLIESRLNRKF